MIVGGNRIESATVLWTAGVAPSPILAKLGVKTDQAGRVCVGPFLDVPDKPGIFVVGDAAAVIVGPRGLNHNLDGAPGEGEYSPQSGSGLAMRRPR